MRYIKGQGYRAKLEANRCVILKVRATEPSWKQVCFITGQGYRAKLEAGVFYYWSGLQSQVGSKQVRYIKGQGYSAKLEANRCVIIKVRATEPSWKQTGALY